MIPHSVRQHLRVEIDRYDATIRRFIPGYETMLSIAAGAVAAVRPDLVIDLGAGTGGLSAALLERNEVGTVRLLDADAEMLDQARSRLERFGDRVQFVLRSYDESFAPCDAFAASLSLHHLPTLEAKSFLFERAFAALRPGGVFVNADVNMPQDTEERDPLFRYWGPLPGGERNPRVEGVGPFRGVGGRRHVSTSGARTRRTSEGRFRCRVRVAEWADRRGRREEAAWRAMILRRGRLFRIDLSHMVNKYMGETEKNLDQ